MWFNRQEQKLLVVICAVLVVLGMLTYLADSRASTEVEPIQEVITEPAAPSPPEAVPAAEPVRIEEPEVQEMPLVSVETVRIMQGEFTVTAYCSCQKCCGYWATVRPLDENSEPIVYTASGTVAKQGRTIAVDPEVFEYGTEVWLDGPWGEQCFIAEDCGRGVSGRHIDIYFDDHEEARQWGMRQREVWLEMEEVSYG